MPDQLPTENQTIRSQKAENPKYSAIRYRVQRIQALLSVESAESQSVNS